MIICVTLRTFEHQSEDFLCVPRPNWLPLSMDQNVELKGSQKLPDSPEQKPPYQL